MTSLDEQDLSITLPMFCTLEEHFKYFQKHSEDLGGRLTMQQFETTEQLKESNRENIISLCGMFLELRDANVQEAAILAYLKDCLEVDLEQIDSLKTKNMQLEKRLRRIEAVIDEQDIKTPCKRRAPSKTKKKED